MTNHPKFTGSHDSAASLCGLRRGEGKSMTNFKLFHDKTKPSRMAVGDKRPGACYAVLVRGAVIGIVEKCSDKSYRSEGTGSTHLWGFRGYSVVWRGTLTNEWARDSVMAYSRKECVERLLKRWAERVSDKAVR